jgi:hypothetical protein
MIHVNPGSFSHLINEYSMFLAGEITEFDDTQVPEKIREFMQKGIIEWVPDVRVVEKEVLKLKEKAQGKQGIKFIELFAGIGGFRMALD